MAEEVGGITTGNITEDFATGIKIQAKGYTCYATGEPLAHGMAHHGFLSNRKLPRVPLEFSVQSVEGQSIKIINYNYEYLLLQGIYREEEIHLRVGGDNQITCMPEHRDEKLNYTLCKIKAWKEVARNQSIQTCLLYKPQKVVVSQDIGGMSV